VWAFLLLSYGSPEQESDVIPFLKNILGKNVPPQRLVAAAEKYRRFAVQ